MRLQRGRDDVGITMVLVTLALLTLIIMVALVVDIGNGRQTKRRAQNAIDAAALAGVALYDGTAASETAARTRAITLLDLNSFGSLGGSGNDRTCGDGESCAITFTFNGSTVRPCLELAMDDLLVNTSFARVIGTNTLSVDVSSKGCKTVNVAGAGLPAGVGFGTCSPDGWRTFVTSGQNTLFVGAIHSNGSASDQASGNTRTGAATLRTAPPNQDQGLWTGATTSGAVDDPLAPGAATPEQLIARYAPGGARAVEAQGLGLYSSSTNDITLSGSIPAGIYYTTKKIVVSGTGTSVTARNGHTGVILVTSGDKIELSGNGVRLQPFSLSNPNRLTLIAGWDSSGDPCGDEGLNISGECNRVDGVTYVPFTRAKIDGNGHGHDDNGRTGTNCADTPTYNGALVAWSISMSGERQLWRAGPGGSTTSAVFLDT